jgi:hypothetical protein
MFFTLLEIIEIVVVALSFILAWKDTAVHHHHGKAKSYHPNVEEYFHKPA